MSGDRILPSAPDKQTGLLEVGLLLIDVLLDGLGFKSDSERRAEIENHASAIRRRYLDEASTGDQLESADELDEAAPSLVSDRIADPVVDDGGYLTRHESSPSSVGSTPSVGDGSGPGDELRAHTSGPDHRHSDETRQDGGSA